MWFLSFVSFQILSPILFILKIEIFKTFNNTKIDRSIFISFPFLSSPFTSFYFPSVPFASFCLRQLKLVPIRFALFRFNLIWFHFPSLCLTPHHRTSPHITAPRLASFTTPNNSPIQSAINQSINQSTNQPTNQSTD
jgi:hypothetical protein